MSKTKQGKTTKGSRRPNPKYLGVKMFGGEKAIPGNIIVRQRGTKFRPGKGVKLGKDYTIYAVEEGRIVFSHKFERTYVNVG